MADFPVCPSSERIMSVLPPFCRGAVKTERFYRKVVSANLFADTLPKSKGLYRTIPQSLRDSSLYTREPLACPIVHPHTVGQTVQQIPNLSLCRVKPVCKKRNISMQRAGGSSGMAGIRGPPPFIYRFGILFHYSRGFMKWQPLFPAHHFMGKYAAVRKKRTAVSLAGKKFSVNLRGSGIGIC